MPHSIIIIIIIIIVICQGNHNHICHNACSFSAIMLLSALQQVVCFMTQELKWSGCVLMYFLLMQQHYSHIATARHDFIGAPYIIV